MLHRFRFILIVLSVLALAACGEKVVKRVSEPASSLQQLTVNVDGSWKVALRLQNFSSMPMRFDDVALKLSVGDAEAGTLSAKPGVSIGGASADVIELQLQPAAQARLIVADALASNHTLAYTLEGSVSATPEEKKQRTFQINNRSTLNHAPGLPGVLR
ncbi:LEA type 2 family protein [Stenotrophomonas sp. CFBP 13724]|uniref:NDR1/HIN1-like protein n=1 Tax=Stenotrophomonas sp. CFBP 13724 TaxID=2775298 RepID=UPI001783BE68|nr:LEA type 2 family protein [Stenotrophomonas sp. CFBP 13724]MBD8642756.1 LEA type 2 family protein [Stenotrophomonas sp. CFBP 13724]